MSELYGVPFPDSWSNTKCELQFYRFPNLREASGFTPDEHLLRSIRTVYPKKEFAISSWTEWRAWSWCNHQEISWVGSGACGKSCDAAMFAKMDFLAAPDETSTTIYSTTKNMLRRRIWRDLVRFHEFAPFGLYYRRGDFMITPDNKPDTINFLSGAGILRDDGTVQVSNLFGVHNKRNRVIIDEAQGCPYFLIEGMVNAQLGGDLSDEGFKALAMGNPEDEEDTLCRFCAPNGGWLTLDVNDKQWIPAAGGIALHFDGLDSPAIVEPNGTKEYPFYIRQKDVDNIKKRFTEDSIRYMSQVRGWLVRGAAVDRVIDYPTLDQFNVWTKGIRGTRATALGACDPAFSSGGDRCQMAYADLYKDDFGSHIVEFTDMESIPISGTDERPLAYMLVDQIRESCIHHKVLPNRLAMDITGQQKVLPDVITKEWMPGIHRVDFNGNASDNIFDAELKLLMKDVYFNRVTELWMLWTELVKASQLRGLDRDTAKEWTARRIKWKGKRQQIEPKDKMRARVGYSPDKADAQAILVDLALVRYGVVIGAARPLPIEDQQFQDHSDMLPSYDSELIG